MKRLIITSLCTLSLSAFGAIGVNQNQNDINEIKSTNNVNIDTEESTTEVERNITNDSDTTAKMPDAEIKTEEEVVANDSNTNKRDAIEQTQEENNEIEESKTNEETKKAANTQNKIQAVKLLKKETQKNNGTPVRTASKNVATVNKSNKEQVMYQNIDLSECETTSDVVEMLQKNGYQNINISNIRNNESLQEILSKLQENKTETSTTDKQATKDSSKQQPITNNTKPANTSVAPSNTGISNYAAQVLQLVNQERAKAGLSAFTTTPELTAAANQRAKETVQSFSHTRPNGTSFSTALKEFNVSYRTAGENIAYGQKTPQEVVNGWMNSPGHRANILNSSFHKIGIGVYQSNGTIYWSQLFTN